ncbi:peptidase S8 [Paenibacillus sp. CGMCC 1.16610]|uniref:S8 family serine peptidase n=1 Tax=Paenibacillus anseongense TaxID=2682845 RepID=A0ABW9UFL1_9BACL|nr:MULTISPECIES: S8 family peptidase [Paenibacillus]MBA2938123.1 peptidase S8 [Paenibacillus sp. CGMCC 1.16610]MVQ37180.1 S8 family serine peptidase [Paenibacillus anseongense]
MWRYLSSISLVLGLGFVLFPHHSNNENTPGPEVYSAKYETEQKLSLLQQDVKLTDDLCRSQCSIDYSKMISQIESGESAAKVLGDMKTHHEKMDVLIWSKNKQALDQGIKVGEIPASYKDQASKYLAEAKAATESGKHYQSPKFGAAQQVFFVQGTPSTDGNSSLIGVIHQDILHHVTDHQMKNLRLEPYPNENRWKVESVDTDTLKDKVVDHPEDNQGTSHYHQNEVVVKFKKDPTEAQLSQIKSEIKANSMQKLGYTYVFRTEGMEAKALMAYFKKWDVAYVEPHFLYLTNDYYDDQEAADEKDSSDYTDSTDSTTSPDETTSIAPNFKPNDNLYSRYQWNLPLIETEQGWQLNRGTKDVVVAVVDTGVDLQHPDLKDKLLPGYNVISGDDQPQDDVGHGTHVTGVIAALVNNNLGVAGISWYNKVLPVKVLDQTGAGSTYSVAQGIIWAADHGAKVMNLSLGNYADSGFLHDAIKYAYDKDVALIAASGNDNTERPGYPAAYPEVFAVAASDSENNKAPFSNYGDYIDVTAPGVSIASTYPNNQYAALSGTSMASPHVTALAALIRSTNPNLKNTEVYQIMRDTAQDIGTPGHDKYFGYGLIDVVKAVQKAEEQPNVGFDWPSRWFRQMNLVSKKYAGVALHK